MKTQQEERQMYDAVAKNVRNGMKVGEAIDATGLFQSRATFYHIVDKNNFPRFNGNKANGPKTRRLQNEVTNHKKGNMIAFTPNGEGMERIEIETMSGIKIRVPFTPLTWETIVKAFSAPRNMEA